MITAELVQQTEARFAERTAVREERAARLESGAVLEADSPERVRMRLQRIARMSIETEGIGPPVNGAAAGASLDALERIIGKNDLMSVRYLELAVRVARTVGRVQVRGPDGNLRGYGTGFLVSPRLMLTNNHVLDSAATAGASRVEFDFQEGIDGRLLTSVVVNFDPTAFFTTDKALDFALVALKGDLTKVTPFGWNGPSADEGKVIAGEYVTIIQHPSGERKQIAIRENRIIDVLESFLHYHTDTAPGSSGSPVFNDQWEVVALHHSGVPKKDAEGRILTTDGKVWTKSMGDNAIAWVANEGVRISRILKHLAGLSLSGTAATLRKQLLESEAGWRSPAGTGTREMIDGATGVESTSSGSIWTLPLQLSIDVSRPGGGVRISSPGATVAPGETHDGGASESTLAIPDAILNRMNGSHVTSPMATQFESTLPTAATVPAPTPAPTATTEETAESWLIS
jgi:endonuclease G